MYRKGKIKNIYFVGIGGIGMSGIAEVLLNLGYSVSGSDIKETDVTRRLQALGCEVSYGHRKENVKEADVVVVSSAIRQDNPEVEVAEERLIPIIPRAEMLAELMRMKVGIAIAGTHGKTTTTSLIATVLGAGGLDPTVVIGGRLNSIGSNARLGQGEFLVAEADESDGSFLKLMPTIAVVTNIDPEHLDYYKGIDEIKETFLNFLDKIPFFGLAVLCLDHPNIQSLIPRLKKRFTTYGLTTQADFQAKEIEFEGLSTTFDVLHQHKEIGRLRIQMPGLHNVYNALATVATAFELDIPFQIVQETLRDFSGIQRRFQIKGEKKGILIVDDYGHHPVEIMATLKAARTGWKRRIVAVFQPHRYTRTQALFHDFLTAFYDADVLILTDIYPAGEDRIEGVGAKALSEGVREYSHKDVTYLANKKEIVAHLLRIVTPGDLVITLGAGDIWQVADELANRLG
ncbi:MAG: UDP-N-acetylmuramate--L-alanine ligase [Deltaproteobacteria bacterium RBG_16_48_10]|nr:MAG: UDP-N-acetylmuramate--L-alanine ligase [Deltaproteobacteria bacterium RBG_16_48_10]